MDGAELYRILGVDPSVDGAQLARAFRSKVRELHPDTRPDAAVDAMVDVLAAYHTLRDPQRRARYDQQRAATPPDGGGIRIPVTIRRTVPPEHQHLLRVGPVRVEPLAPPHLWR